MKINKIQNKFILTSALILAASLALTLLIAYYQSEEAITGFVKAELKSNTEENAELISRFYDEKTRLGLSLTQEPLIMKAAEEQAADLRGPHPLDSPITKISSKTLGEVLSFLAKTDDFWLTETGERQFDLLLSDIYGYVFADAVGGATIGLLNNEEARGGNWWTKVFIEGERAFGDLEWCPAPGKENLIVSVIGIAIKDEKGISGAVGMPVFFNEIGESIANKVVGETGYNILIDKYGRLLVHPNKEYILEKTLSDLKAIDLAEISQKMVAGQSGSGTFVQDGTKYYIYYTPVKAYGEYPGQGLSIASVISEKELLAEVNTMRDLIIWLIIATILIASGIIYFIARRITDPITNLRNAAAEIGRGRLDTKIEIQTKDEIGELAFAFNQMIKDLKESREKLEKYSEELERKVGERTKELQAKMTELEKFNKLAVGREMQMIELKKKIKELEGRLAKTKPKS